MASPSTVISRGYGSWGSVNELPTLGYGIGTVPTERTIYRPNRATDPAAYYPGRSVDPAAYRPLMTPLPPLYNPQNPSTPAD